MKNVAVLTEDRAFGWGGAVLMEDGGFGQEGLGAA